VRKPRSQSLIPAVVALSVVLCALAEGGYSVEARAILALLVWTTVISGVAFNLFPRSRLPDASVVAGGLLAVLVLLTGISVAWASDDGAAVQEFVRVGGYLGLFALVLCTARDGELRPWLVGLALGITAVGVLAVSSRLVPSLPGGDEEIAQFLPGAAGRLSFPIGYWNGLAALLALGAVLLAWLGAFARTRRGRAAATAALPVLGLGIYLTSSRGGYAALAAGLIVLIALGPRGKAVFVSALLGAVGTLLAIALASGQSELIDGSTGSAARSQGAILLAAMVAYTLLTGATRAWIDDAVIGGRLPQPSRRTVLAIGAIGLVALVVAVNPVKRWESFVAVPTSAAAGSGDLERGSGSGRWQFWNEAIDAFGSEPVHGLGAGGFGNYWNQHATIDQVVTQAHSLYLEQLAELGPAALIVLLGFLILGAVRSVADRSVFSDPGVIAAPTALLATGAVSAAVDWTWEIPVVFGPVVVASALLVGPALIPKAVAAFAPPPSATRIGLGSDVRPPVKVLLLSIGAVIVLLAGSSLLSERRLEASRDAATRQDPSRYNPGRPNHGFNWRWCRRAWEGTTPRRRRSARRSNGRTRTGACGWCALESRFRMGGSTTRWRPSSGHGA
jgi:hypothetical protein